MEEKINHHPCCEGFKKHFVLRWILGIIILVAVFCIGFKLGEFSSVIRQGGYGYGYYNNNMYDMMGGGYPYYMMGGQGYYGGQNPYNNNYYYGPGMMRGFYGNYPGATTTPSR